jgi:hypothetical protein
MGREERDTRTFRKVAESACRAFTAGMCGTQLASTRPLTTKMVETAHRERMGSRRLTRGGDALLGVGMMPVLAGCPAGHTRF